MKANFIIANIIMLAAPMILLGALSIFFLILFIRLYPAEAIAFMSFKIGDFMGAAEYLKTFLAGRPSAAFYLSLWFLSSAAVLCGAAAAVTRFQMRMLLPPVTAVSESAEHIRSGDLSYEVTGSSVRELNRMCVSFDEMRLAIKRNMQREKSLTHERSMILANLSHDVKTPVTAIKGYIRGIQDGMASDTRILNKYLKTIYQKADSIETMMDGLSVFSKLDMNKIQFSFTIGDIYEYVRSIAEDFMLDAQNCGCTLTEELPKEKCYIKIDYEMLYRVFANLIDNSIKYRSDENPYIRITSSERTDGVLISVADNGIGMPDDELDKIFDGFYRIDSSRSKQGSGLGLGIARRIVESHGGRMWFKSGLKQGSEAVIYLPKRSHI